jgi:hypothetical protein
MRYVLVAIALVPVLAAGYAVYLARVVNPRVVRELHESPDGERARRVMLISLPSGRTLPVNSSARATPFARRRTAAAAHRADRRALANPEVRVSVDGQSTEHRAVLVTGEEHERVDSDHRLGTVFRILTGFPPRYFLRLDPV